MRLLVLWPLIGVSGHSVRPKRGKTPHQHRTHCDAVRVDWLQMAEQVVVTRGTGYTPKRRKGSTRLATERNASEVSVIASFLLNVVPDDGDHALMEWPSISIAFVKAGEVVAEFGLLGHGDWVPQAFGGDRRLVDASAVRDWLTRHGVPLDWSA